MAKTRSYKRYFIILENEDKGFENNRKNLPKGYVKIEVRNGKGLLNIYTQDLKHFEDAKYIYRNYLINTKESNYVDLGTLIVDEKGRGEYKLKIDPDNVDGAGSVLENFNVVAIVAEPLDRASENKVFGPLVGYINKKKTEWKPSVLKNKNNKENVEKVEETKEVKETKKEIKKDEKENKKVEDIQDNKKNEAKETKEVKEEKKTKPKEIEDVKEIEKPKKENKEIKKEEKIKEEVEAEKQKEIKEETKEKAEQVKEEVKEQIKEQTKETEEIKDIKKDVKAQEEKKIKEEKDQLTDMKQGDKKDTAPIENIGEIEENKEVEGAEAEEELSEEYKKKHEKIMKIIEEEAKVLYKEKENIELMPEKKHGDIVNEEDVLKAVKVAQEKEEKASEKNSNKKEYQSNMKKKYYGGNKPCNQYERYYRTVHRYVNDMLKYSEEMKPFENNIQGCRWWQMKYSQQNMHRVFLPFFGYVLNIYYHNPYVYYMNNCNELMDKYGHYIFGIEYDRNNEPKHYIYGIPGRYLYKEQPFRGMTGFVYWHPIENKKPQRGDYGYWLLHIDSKTGNVVFPFDPTIPPMY